MKTIQIVSLIAFSFLSFAKVNAQQTITRQNGSSISFYNVLDSAITYAQSGDTIYISGGGFTLSVPINKPLHIFGVGFRPDSTIATKNTIIASDIYVLSNASNGSLTGIYCTGSLRFGNSTSNQDVSNFKISRCNFKQSAYLGFDGMSGAVNNVFIENIIRRIFLFNARSNNFYNNIIIDYAKDIGLNNVFRNNNFNNSSAKNYADGYFWYGVPASIVNAIGAVFENNIFRGGLFSAGGYNPGLSNCVFYNCLFSGAPSCMGCTDFNSIVNQPDATILINFPNYQDYQYSFDSHLQSASPGKNAGTDGNDIGIYGGAFPWKDGSLPVNPHIQFKSISNTTDSNGNLQINIKVKAQKN